NTGQLEELVPEQTRLLWRNMQLFDGMQTAAEPMAVVVNGGRIETVCPDRELDTAALGDARECGHGGVITPGLVDCHTHLVFGGQRADEFEQRLQGGSDTQIAESGGGIISTVRATRTAPEDALSDRAAPRLHALPRAGVTT